MPLAVFPCHPAGPGGCRLAAPLRRLAAASALCLGLAVLAGPAVASAGSGVAAAMDAMQTIIDAALDDPKAALLLGRQRLAASQAQGDHETAFWLRLGLVDVLVQSENETLARQELAAAAAERVPGDGAPRRRLWLDLYTALAHDSPTDAAAFARQQAARRQAARTLGDERLLCNIDMLDAVVYNDLDASDEAWQALEAVELCAGRLADVSTQTYALGTMGLLAARVSRQMPAQAYFERAAQVLGQRPARFKRAWLLDDLGWALLQRGELEAARGRFEQALSLSLALADVAGSMRGHEGLAEVLLKQGDAEGTLRHARQALRLGDTAGLRARQVTAQTQIVEAMVLLKRPQLGAEVDQLRALARPDSTPHIAALIARNAARGYQALGQHALAYAELERYVELARADEQARRDRDAQHLQARYEAVRREAENSELRHAAVAAGLELEARTARQRALWVAVLALLLVLACGSWYFGRALRRRRRLAELALRDELTGLPNRRAVMAFAREQFNVSRRLALPFSLALIDLDRFKQINDTYGHATGDRVLEAFAGAAASVVRGQDRIGRYGGEEWLLVMPGTRADEFAPVFERLRQGLAEQAVPGLARPHGVTFSMGVAQWREGLDSLESLIAEADHHLYQAKALGRDALCSAAARVLPRALPALHSVT